MKKFREYFKPKPKEKKQPLPASYWFLLIVLSLLILNFALLLPPQLSALWFELQLLVIQFFRNPITLQTWAFIVVLFITAFIGWYSLPVVEIPNTNDSYIYTYRWEEGSMVFFRTLTGKIIIMNKKVPKRKLLRWIVVYPVSRNPQGRTITYETDSMEVSAELKYKRYAEALAEEIAHLYAEKERSETRLSIDEVLEIIRAKHGGESE